MMRAIASRGSVFAWSPTLWPGWSALVTTRRILSRPERLRERLVGLAGHGGIGDCRMLAQCRFDLAGADLVAAALDQVGGLAADDTDRAVGVEDTFDGQLRQVMPSRCVLPPMPPL